MEGTPNNPIKIAICGKQVLKVSKFKEVIFLNF